MVELDALYVSQMLTRHYSSLLHLMTLGDYIEYRARHGEDAAAAVLPICSQMAMCYVASIIRTTECWYDKMAMLPNTSPKTCRGIPFFSCLWELHNRSIEGYRPGWIDHELRAASLEDFNDGQLALLRSWRPDENAALPVAYVALKGILGEDERYESGVPWGVATLHGLGDYGFAQPTADEVWASSLGHARLHFGDIADCWSAAILAVAVAFRTWGRLAYPSGLRALRQAIDLVERKEKARGSWNTDFERLFGRPDSRDSPPRVDPLEPGAALSHILHSVYFLGEHSVPSALDALMASTDIAGIGSVAGVFHYIMNGSTREEFGEGIRTKVLTDRLAKDWSNQAARIIGPKERSFQASENWYVRYPPTDYDI